MLFEPGSGQALSSKTVEFGCVPLNVAHEELVSAWKHEWNSEIQDYKLENEKKCCVLKRELITVLPPLLFFQVNRVSLSADLRVVKLNDRFEFAREIFVDQFLEEHMRELLKNESEIADINAEINLLKERIDRFDNYFGEQHSIIGGC